MNINYTAPINRLGYGVVGLNLAMGLKTLGHRLALWPLGNVEVEDRHAPAIREMISNQAEFDSQATSLRVWHPFDMAHHIGRGLQCGYTTFELDTLTPRDRHHLSRLDKIVVASRWAQRIVVEQLGCPVERTIVAPHGVDRSVFHEGGGQTDPNWTTFLHIGKWERRKGQDVLLEAFNRAFDPHERVRLAMLCHNPFLSVEQNAHWEQCYKCSKMGGNVVLLPRVNSHGDVAAIMAKADCGVFPSRAEGWNLGLLEMMSLGKRVIATNYSAHTEFCTAENCMLVDVGALEAAYDGIWFHGQGRWAALGEREVGQLAEQMRAVYQQKRKGLLQINEAGIGTAKRLSWENTASSILDGLHECDRQVTCDNKSCGDSPPKG